MKAEVTYAKQANPEIEETPALGKVQKVPASDRQCYHLSQASLQRTEKSSTARAALPFALCSINKID